MDCSADSPEKSEKMGVDTAQETIMLLPLSREKLTEKWRADATRHILDENDKKVFEALKALIFAGDWESLFVKLMEHQDFLIDSQDRTHQNFTLLHYAAQRKQVDCLRVLLENFQASPNIQSESGSTAIHLLVSSDCRCNKCAEKIQHALQILMDSGANINLEDDLGETPLYNAARNRLGDAAKFLLTSGANINHWVNGTSVATLLAQYVPDVLKSEFDMYIEMDEKKGNFRGVRLDFRLLLQETAIREGFSRTKSSTSLSPPKRKEIFPVSTTDPNKKTQQQIKNSLETTKASPVRRCRSLTSLSSGSRATSISFCSSEDPPKETELLNYLLMADLAAIETVVNHPLVEAFVHLKWLSVRKLFFLQRSLYLFLISLYTFYVFDTFVNATCFYNSAVDGRKAGNGTSISTANVTTSHVEISARNPNESETILKSTFGIYFPSSSNTSSEGFELYSWHSFADYFKAHEMTCEPKLGTTVVAYLLAIFAVTVVLSELYKMCESWHDYFQQPLSYAWWLVAVNIAITLVPGLRIYAHTWLYPYAAFSLMFGWIMVLTQIRRIPYFGIFVGIFIKVLQDFCLLLLTFTPVLLAFAFGFSVMLPQNDFFQAIPLACFKVFLMMTGDVDFWGVFKGTWTTAEHQGHVFIPLFLIYSAYILIVTMVLMSLLLGLAVDNIQEVRRETTLRRTVGTIKEIGVFESLFQQPLLSFGGCSKILRRLFSITSLKYMNGPELITFPEDPSDTTLPAEIKQKLIPYLNSCCCSEPCASDDPGTHQRPKKGGRRKEVRKKEKNGELKARPFPETSQLPNDSGIRFRGNLSEDATTNILLPRANLSEEEQVTQPNNKSNETIRQEAFETSNKSGKLPALGIHFSKKETTEEALLKDMVRRDLVLFHEIKMLLDDNDKLRGRLESLKRKLITKKGQITGE